MGGGWIGVFDGFTGFTGGDRGRGQGSGDGGIGVFDGFSMGFLEVLP